VKFPFGVHEYTVSEKRVQRKTYFRPWNWNQKLTRRKNVIITRGHRGLRRDLVDIGRRRPRNKWQKKAVDT